jgi:flagellar hook assembly protein FlgD
VEIQVYNLIGSRVARLVSEVQTAGAHQISWQGTDGQGRVLPKGMYIIRIKTGELISNLKVLKE